MSLLTDLTFDQILISLVTCLTLRELMIALLPASVVGPQGWLLREPRHD